MKQLSFFQAPVPKKFGGELFLGQRKSARPLSSKHALHLVLRAELAKGQDLTREIDAIHEVFEKFAQRFTIRIYDDAVVSNHIHLLIKSSDRQNYCGFVRAVSGGIAAKLKIKWQHRPFTRIVEWGRDFHSTKRYVFQNELEAAGIIPYQKRSCRR